MFFAPCIEFGEKLGAIERPKANEERPRAIWQTISRAEGDSMPKCIDATITATIAGKAFRLEFAAANEATIIDFKAVSFLHM